jgi:hypothetical protein
METAVLGSFNAGWKTPQRIPIHEWANKNVVLPGSYAIRGPFHVERSKYLKKPLESLQSPDIQRVTIYKAVQTGGSLVSEIWVCWLIENYPGPTMWNFQTDDDAKEAAEQRINPLFENCKAVMDKMPYDRSKRQKMAIYFLNMWLLMQGPGLSNIQSKSVQNLINDEIWIWPPGNHTQALKRVTAFGVNSKVLDISQGGTKNDEMDNSYMSGTREEWGFKCPACQKLQPYEWGQIKWDHNEITYPEGKPNFNLIKQTIRYECNGCGHKIRDTSAERRQMNDSGEYIVTNPNASPNHVSYHWNAMASDAIKWSTLVEEWIEAHRLLKVGSIQALMDFIQKRLAESWDEEKHQLGQTIEIKTSDYRFEDTSPETKWGDFRFFTLDVQAKELWGVIRDWKRTGESRLVWAGSPLTWGEAEELAIRYKVNPWDVFPDSGFDTDTVYRKCLDHGWIALKGSDRERFFHTRKNKKPIAKIFSEKVRVDTGIGTVKQGNPKGFIHLFHWSNPSAKDILQRLMNGVGADWGVPNNIFPEYTRQLTAEVKKEVIDKKTGRPKFIWVRIRKANHLFDCEAMQVVAASMERIIGAGEDEAENPQ